jgi:hypothetical protein
VVQADYDSLAPVKFTMPTHAFRLCGPLHEQNGFAFQIGYCGCLARATIWVGLTNCSASTSQKSVVTI